MERTTDPILRMHFAQAYQTADYLQALLKIRQTALDFFSPDPGVRNIYAQELPALDTSDAQDLVRLRQKHGSLMTSLDKLGILGKLKTLSFDPNNPKLPDDPELRMLVTTYYEMHAIDEISKARNVNYLPIGNSSDQIIRIGLLHEAAEKCDRACFIAALDGNLDTLVEMKGTSIEARATSIRESSQSYREQLTEVYTQAKVHQKPTRLFVAISPDKESLIAHPFLTNNKPTDVEVDSSAPFPIFFTLSDRLQSRWAEHPDKPPTIAELIQAFMWDFSHSLIRARMGMSEKEGFEGAEAIIANAQPTELRRFLMRLHRLSEQEIMNFLKEKARI